MSGQRPLEALDGGEQQDTAAMPAPDRLSILGHLKERREEVKTAATIDLQVERWSDPELFVRFKPVDHAIIRSGGRKVEVAPDKAKSQVEVDINADVLIAGCVGVFARVDGEEFSLRPGDPRGPWTKFDPDLAENLGCEHSARKVVKALYIFDGDIITTAGKVAEFSGYREKYADEEVAGES
jgi:hypothetical protein